MLEVLDQIVEFFTLSRLFHKEPTEFEEALRVVYSRTLFAAFELVVLRAVDRESELFGRVREKRCGRVGHLHGVPEKDARRFARASALHAVRVRESRVRCPTRANGIDRRHKRKNSKSS